MRHIRTRKRTPSAGARRRRSLRPLSCEKLEPRSLLATMTFWVDGDFGPGGNGSAAMPFDTIQEGIDAARLNDADPGEADVVRVRPAAGGYTENVVIDDPESLIVRGTTGDPADIIVTAANSDDDVISIKQVPAGERVTLGALRVTRGEDGIDAEEIAGTLVLREVEAVRNEQDGLDADNDSPAGVVRILGGSYSRNGEDGMALDWIETVVARHVQAVRNGRHPDVENGDGLDVDDADRVTVEGGNYSGNRQDGLDLDRVTTTSLRDVEAIGNHEDGLDLADAGRLIVNGGTFSRNSQDGMEIDRVATVVARWAHAGGNHASGADIDQAVSVNLVGGNYAGNGTDGIALQDVERTVADGVSAGRNRQNGLTAVDGPDDNGSDSLRIRGSLLSGNKNDGVNLTGIDRVVLADSWMDHNGDDGIDIDSADAVRVDNVSASRNRDDDGLDIEGARQVRVIAGWFNGNGDEGIQLREVAEVVDVRHVDASRNGDDGLTVVRSEADVTVRGGVFLRNRGDGIDMDEITGLLRIVDAVARFNHDNGLEIREAGDVRVVGGDYSRNRGNGIFMRDVGQVLLLDVTARRNLLDGVHIECHQGVTLIGGFFAGNGDDDLDIDPPKP